jgi:two-component system sensor histidine kinase KdpD
MFYLLGVLLAASRLSRGPALFAAVASVAALDFFFVPPFYTFAVEDTRHWLTFLVMMFVGVMVSSLTLRVRGQAEAARQRERRTAGLYAMSREFAAGTSVDDLARTAARCVNEILECDAIVFVADGRNTLVPRGEPGSALASDARELAVARWVYEHAQEAGRGTQTLPGAQGLYLPLVGSRRTLGVVGVNLSLRHGAVAPSQRQLLETYVAHTALALDRTILAEEAAEATLAAERELTRSGLLSAVSHDVRTPLSSIQGSATALIEEGDRMDPDARRDLLATIREESGRLGRLVGDLLDLTRLESGGPRVRKEWHPVEDLVGAALSRLDDRLRGREVRVDLPRDVLLVQADPLLVEQVVWNLVENATKHTPPGTAIEVGARRVEGGVAIAVADRGPGIPAGEEQRIFEKFYRTADGQRTPGAGLGLAICHAAAKAHGGWMRAENRPEGGARFILFLPSEAEPPVPAAEG